MSLGYPLENNYGKTIADCQPVPSQKDRSRNLDKSKSGRPQRRGV